MSGAPATRRQWNGALHYIDGQRLYASQANLLLTGNGERGPVEPLTRLPLVGWRKVCARWRPLARLLRQSVYHVTPFRDRLIVMAFDQIWCLERATGLLVAPPSRLVGGRPLAVCAAPHGVYYGEYRSNPERSTIRLFSSLDGVTWQVAKEFTGVRHIHGVFHDRFTDAIWVTTGDTDAESALWRSSDCFATIERVLSGSQQARAISLVFTEGHVYYGSDTPLERNYLYRLDRSSGQVQQLAPVAGSVFHGTAVGRHLLFSSAVEPSKSNRSNNAFLYASADGQTWNVVARHRKDAWPMKFQYGQLALPAGHNATKRYWYSTFAVDQDNLTISGQLDDE